MRKFVDNVLFFIIIFLFIFDYGALISQDHQLIFVGTNTGNVEEGIYAVSFSEEDGSFEMLQQHKEVLNPNYIVPSQDGNVLFAVHHMADQPEGAVSSFKIDKQSAALALISTVSSSGRGPCYVGIDSEGKWMMVANYSSGNISLYTVDKEGGIVASTDVVQHKGTGPDESRQKGPHAHYIHMGTGGLIYAADLGADKVFLYQLDGKRQSFVPHTYPYLSVPAGSGPRHVDFHPEAPFVYVLNELNGTVSGFMYDEKDQSFSIIETVSTMPENFEGYNKSADIHVHPNGKFLYASNRGDLNSISIFEIDEKSGKITLLGHQSEDIAWPRNFTISPNGEYMIVANRDSNSIYSFRIHPQTGLLENTQHSLTIPKPVCVKFIP